MKEINAYLTFGGNCREAMQFYAKCTGGELFVMTFAEAPGNFPPEAKNLVMHAAIKKGDALIMASDAMPGMPLNIGNNVWVAIKCESADEVNRLYAAFSEGGQAVMPPGETFWAARFAMCTDKFSINWMFNFEKPRTA
jgi:PhnB protein